MAVSTETLVSTFWENADGMASRSAMLVKREGAYVEVPWSELAEAVRATAAGLITAGVEGGDRVALMSENRLEWVIADYAIMSAGGITVALYAPLTAAQVQEQLADAAPTAAFVSTGEQLEKLLSVIGTLPSIRTVVCFDSGGVADGPSLPLGERDGAHSLHIRTLSDLRKEGSERMTADPTVVERRTMAVTPEDLAAISYTSGTTGESKGVMLTHSNLVSNVRAMIDAVPMDRDAVIFTFLPLNHIYARTCDLYYALTAGLTLALAESIDTILQNLQEVKPHHFSGVPRVHQKLSDLARPAFAAGDREALRKLLGGRIRWVSAGGAALPVDVAKFYFEAGVPIYQGYGLTETSPVISFSCEGRNRIGAAGKALTGVDVKIAPDGEILSRGPHIFKGYWNRPKSTAEVLEPDGWFHTGDVGYLDEEGFLFITDRKKDILVTAYGKNVAPQQIEGLIVFDPHVEQAMVYGDGRPFLTALIVPSREALKHWASAHGLGEVAWEALIERPDVRALYEERIALALKDVSSHEQVRRFLLLPEPFSAARGEMTVTAKLRRRALADHYREALDALYA